MTLSDSLVAAIARAVQKAGGDANDVDDMIWVWERLQADRGGRVDLMRAQAERRRPPPERRPEPEPEQAAQAPTGAQRPQKSLPGPNFGKCGVCGNGDWLGRSHHIGEWEHRSSWVCWRCHDDAARHAAKRIRAQAADLGCCCASGPAELEDGRCGRCWGWPS